MCGIFGIYQFKQNVIDFKTLRILVTHARSRGKDASGFLVAKNEQLNIYRSHEDIAKLYKKLSFRGASGVFGHSRLVTNGSNDNQPIYKHDCVLFHNGIVVNDSELWDERDGRQLEIDSEIILDLYQEAQKQKYDISQYIFERAEV